METNGKNRFESQGDSIAQMMYVRKYKSHRIAHFNSMKKSNLAAISFLSCRRMEVIVVEVIYEVSLERYRIGRSSLLWNFHGREDVEGLYPSFLSKCHRLSLDTSRPLLQIVWTVLILVIAAKSLLIDWPPHSGIGNAQFS